MIAPLKSNHSTRAHSVRGISFVTWKWNRLWVSSYIPGQLFSSREGAVAATIMAVITSR